MSSHDRLFARLFSKAEMRRHYLAAEPSLRIYLHEVGQTPLLSAEQERLVLKRIAEGNEQAKQHLIEANLRLVVTIALHFQDRGVPLLDLIQEGNLGLWQALARFDPTHNARFATYAKYRVLKRIEQAIAEHNTSVLIQEQQEPLSLDQLFADGNTLTNVLQAPPLLLAHADPELSPLSAQMVQVLSTQLSHRERLVIGHRFGLGEATTATRKELAQQLGVTEERIRQIEMAALKKLRAALEKYMR